MGVRLQGRPSSRTAAASSPPSRRTTPAVQTDNVRDGQLAAAISTAVVQILCEHTGRGPDKTRTRINDDLICVVVHDTLTRMERTLVATGRTDLVVSGRTALQQAMRSKLVAAVEALTGRGVIGFFADSSIDPDIAIEAFLLAPQSETPRGH